MMMLAHHHNIASILSKDTEQLGDGADEFYSFFSSLGMCVLFNLLS